MKERFKGLLRKGASAAVNSDLVRGQLLKLANTSKLARYAVAEDLHLNLQTRRAVLKLRLLGEASSVEVVLRDFAIVGTDELFIRIREVEVDREWMQHMADDHVAGSLIPIPAAHHKWAAKLQGVLG